MTDYVVQTTQVRNGIGELEAYLAGSQANVDNANNRYLLQLPVNFGDAELLDYLYYQENIATSVFASGSMPKIVVFVADIAAGTPVGQCGAPDVAYYDGVGTAQLAAHHEMRRPVPWRTQDYLVFTTPRFDSNVADSSDVAVIARVRRQRSGPMVRPA